MATFDYLRVVSSSGLFVGAIRPLQKLFYGSGGPQVEAPPLFFLIDSLSILAGAAIPGMMLVLGALLAYGPQRGVLPTRTILASIAVKQILVPAIGEPHIPHDVLTLLVYSCQCFSFDGERVQLVLTKLTKAVSVTYASIISKICCEL